jgi:hypothetical protein
MSVTAALEYQSWQSLGLAFLLGSFSVASLSSIRRLSAQREFVELWWLFAFAVLVFDIVFAIGGSGKISILALKWGLIIFLSFASWVRVGWIFRLAPGDVSALAAAASLLQWQAVLAYYVIAKVLSWGMAPILSGGRVFYPFMPVTSIATIVILVVVSLLKQMG